MSRSYPTVLGQTATEILINLSVQPMVAAALESRIATQTVRMHLPRLHERGFIKYRMSGTGRRIYFITPKGLKELRLQDAEASC